MTWIAVYTTGVYYRTFLLTLTIAPMPRTTLLRAAFRDGREPIHLVSSFVGYGMIHAG